MAVSVFGLVHAQAETLESALATSYLNNPTLNAQRASARAIDEKVPQALSGFRPQVSLNADTGINWGRVEASGGAMTSGTTNPRGYGATITQNVFNGFRTLNQTRATEAEVLSSRETLRNTEQNVLLDGATAYMNMMRDEAIVGLRKQNLEALREQLRATRDRFNVGEVTRTDVAQTEARVAGAESDLSAAEAQLNSSRAAYRRDIGEEPRKLTPARSVEHLVPKTLETSIAAGLDQHPAIIAARYGADAAQLQIKVAEGSLLPTISVDASASRRYAEGFSVHRDDSGSVVGRISAPLYQGGGEYARVRETKETYGQKVLEADVSRDQVRAAVIRSWSLLIASRAQVEAAQSQVRASEIALSGVREEYRVGQRTTLDVLNAQAELVNARVALVTAQRDRVVASYSVLSSVGQLSASRLGLQVAIYEPETHYNQVRDSWFGLRTPDGR